jgi:signal transduction histidine kinase
MNETQPGRPGAGERARVRAYTRQTDTTLYVEVLRAARDEILERWLQAVQRQPFHLGRPERAVSDDIPELFDALLKSLAEESPEGLPLESRAAAEAAKAHARTRAAQGLLPAEVVLEFRLLREEILYCLRQNLPIEEPLSDLLGAQLLLSTALDEAIGMAVNYFAEAVEQAKDDFIAIAAHDLRTPLTVLKGTIQLIRRQSTAGTLEPVSLAAELAMVEAGANRIDQLLTNLLDVTRVREGRLEIHPAPTNLLAVVERALLRLGADARTRIEVIADPALPSGNWEESRIEQVVENLLTNAVKYAPSGPIRVRLQRIGESLRLEVSDQGIGLNAEDHAQLFRRFYRSPEVIERKLEGTGLGLYICRGIVEAHGGEIRATSAGKDQGTTISVTLPLSGQPLTRRW